MKQAISKKELIIKHSGIIIIFGIALLLRSAYLILLSTQYGSDEILSLIPDGRMYIHVAEYILSIHGNAASDLFLIGPGYACILTVFFAVFGKIAWPILIFQIILSSLTCVIIYSIAIHLINEKRIALTAGFLAAISITSISLSNAILTETPFFFLFVLSFYLILKGLHNNRWSYFIISGIAGGLAILVRSVTQFLPLFLIFLPLVFPQRKGKTRSLFFKTVTASLIMLTIAGLWGLRNYMVHDVFVVSGTGAGAAKLYLTARVIHETEPYRELQDIRDDLGKTGIIDGRKETIRERYQETIRVIRETFKAHPGRFIKTYLAIIWENMTIGNQLWHNQLPGYADAIRYYEQRTSRNNRSPVIFVLTVIGLLVLLKDRKAGPAIILFVMLSYFSLLSGVTFWQGSRVFFPAQISWTILVGTALVVIFDGFKNILQKVHKKQASA